MELTQEILKELLAYDPRTGIFEWNVSRGTVNKGDVAGYLSEGYVSIKVFEKPYKAHNLAFLYMTGKFPKNQCDHINRVKNDNRWTNLRDVIISDNQKNMPLRKDSKTGIPGVRWCKRDKKYVVNIGHNGRQVYLGGFNNIFDAAACRIKANKEYGYHENHGR